MPNIGCVVATAAAVIAAPARKSRLETAFIFLPFLTTKPAYSFKNSTMIRAGHPIPAVTGEEKLQAVVRT
jgi:hypothetical protein